MFKPTEQQNEVIKDKTASLIVSASAGSGKTSTMIERIVRLVEIGEAAGGADLAQILVLTFTNAAAADMRQKLYEVLIDKAPISKNCQEALFCVNAAEVSTIDAFCKKIVSEFFYIAEVDPNFKILDASAQGLIKERACKNTINKLFKNKDKEFLTFLFNHFEKRNDEKIKDLIYKVFNFLQTSDNAAHLADITRQSHDENLIKNTAAQIVLSYAHGELTKLQNEMQIYCENCLCENAKEYCARLNMQVNTLVKIKDYDKFFMAIRSFEAEKIAAKDIKEKEEREALKKATEPFIAAAKKYFDNEDLEDVKKFLNLAHKNAGFLLRMANDFEEEFARLKKEKNMLDFADCEAKALKVLQNEQARAAIAAKFKFVFIDEFQDINGIQNSIVESLCAGGQKFFSVGDVKQSIYGFRMTDPKIFAMRYLTAKQNQKQQKAFNLSTNFRSTREILEFNNFIFNAAMNEQNSGQNYARDGAFIISPQHAPSGELCEVFIVKKEETKKPQLPVVYSVADDKGEADDAPYAKAEADIVGSIILNLRKSGFKDGDITLLCRSNKNNYIQQIFKNLTSLGFNLNIMQDDDLTKSYEVQFLHSFLRLANNLKSDIDLVNVMLSPLFNFSVDELLHLRVFHPQGFFYACVLEYNGDNTQIKQKIDAMLASVAAVHDFAKNHSVYETAQKIITSHNYITLINQIGGDETVVKSFLNMLKSAPVDSLTEYAILTEKSSLHAAAEETLAPDKINVATVHGSKGLEYKAVILVGAGKSFNEQDLRDEIFVSSELGISIKHVSSEDDEKLNTLAQNASQILKQQQNLAEEVRILYVALTRAKSKLFVVGAANEKLFNKKIKKDKFGSIFEIIFAALSSQQLQNFADDCEIKIGSFAKFNALSFNEIAPLIASRSTYILPPAKEQLITRFKKDAAQNFGALVPVLSKTSVTKIVNEQNAAHDFVSHKLDEEERERRVLEGNAYHKFFEEFDFEKKQLPPQISAEIDMMHIDAFLKSPLLAMLQGRKILKEQKFVYRMPEGSLVQGIIDLIAIGENDFIIVDFKTTTATPAQIIKRYKQQLLIYSHAAEKILNLRCQKCYIYSIFNANLVEICD